MSWHQNRVIKIKGVEYLVYSLWRIVDTTEMVLDEKRDGLVDENRINSEQKKKQQQKVYTPNKFYLSI